MGKATEDTTLQVQTLVGKRKTKGELANPVCRLGHYQWSSEKTNCQGMSSV